MTKPKNRTGVLAIALWAPLALSLWPLPPQQIDAFLTEVHASRSKFQDTPELEKARSSLIEIAPNIEAGIWTDWCVSLALLLIGIGAWAAYIFQVRGAKVAILLSTVFFLTYLAPNANVYASLFENWFNGSSGFRFLPWRAMFAQLHYHFVMPIGLIVLSSLVFFPARKGNSVGSNASPI